MKTQPPEAVVPGNGNMWGSGTSVLCIILQILYYWKYLSSPAVFESGFTMNWAAEVAMRNKRQLVYGHTGGTAIQGRWWHKRYTRVKSRQWAFTGLCSVGMICVLRFLCHGLHFIWWSSHSLRFSSWGRFIHFLKGTMKHFVKMIDINNEWKAP